MKKLIYKTLGLLLLGIGLIGVVFPIIPTTPFIIISLHLFSKSSEKFYNKIINTKFYKKHLKDFVENKRLSFIKKIFILIYTFIMILIPFLYSRSIVFKIFLVCSYIYACYYFIFKVKTK